MKKIIALIIAFIPLLTFSQKASDMVLLEAIEGSNPSPNPRHNIAFFRTKYEDGKREPSSGTFGYTAPAGRALVITEADWHFGSGKAGEKVTFRIFLTWGSGFGLVERIVLESTIVLGNGGVGGTNIVEKTGIMVPSGVKITFDVIGPGYGGGKTHYVLLRGYLIDGL